MPHSNALDRHWEENHRLLVDAARKAGVDPVIVIKVSGFESGFDAHARPISQSHPDRNRIRQFDGTMATSSAYGLGQFTDDTWLDTIRLHGAKYGVANAPHLTREQANDPALRNDVHLQAAMLAEFTRANVARGERLGGADPDANVYALHNLGAGDGPKFLAALHANPGARVDAVLSRDVIAGNSSLYGDGTRTLADAYRVMGAKMDEFADYAARAPAAATPARSAAAPLAGTHPPVSTRATDGDAANRAAVYLEAKAHFIDAGGFEYGRNDLSLHNRSRNGATDPSRNERDLDGDGLKGVDCSTFVWKGLKSAGFDVPRSPFTTHDLFNGHAISEYSRRHFEVIPAADARHPNGALQPGDILMFKSRSGSGQHVGIFKGYDADGRIQFIGSQVSTGPAEVTVRPHGSWDGRDQEIVGALRAKPEFHVRGAVHGASSIAADGGSPAQDPGAAPPQNPHPRQSAHPQSPAPHATTHHRDTPPPLEPGEQGPAVAHLQRRLFELGYHGKDANPLAVTGRFDHNTTFALQAFQREHGLEGKGIAGPKTEAALVHAETSLMSDPSHPQHRLFVQALGQVQLAEKAKGIPVGPHSERIAATLVVECVREGLQRVDRVLISDSGKLAWAVEDRPGGRESGLGRTDAISLPQASRQPLLESSQQAHQVVVNVQAQQEDARARQVHPSPAPAMAR